ncbi:hypothetical protein [Bifidobacterium cuniculi]|uniref:hypothetical protein n=1 Tax=Bifidobacterium cuniculi TaxID=1688 RepID=UPI000AF251B4|nr:hypothetical protein [Bifidobacterium cuniculi]
MTVTDKGVTTADSLLQDKDAVDATYHALDQIKKAMDQWTKGKTHDEHHAESC